MKWLKGLFTQKKTLEELKQWLVENHQKQTTEHTIKIQQIEQDWTQLLQNSREALTILNEAELKNPNIPERAKHYMQGNREQFTKVTQRFIDNIILPKNPTDISQADLIFKQYIDNTARPGAILSEFFRQEVSETRKQIAQIEAAINTIRQSQQEIDKLNEIKQLIMDLEKTHAEQKHIFAQKENLQEELEQTQNKLETLKKEKEEFTTKTEYLEIKQQVLNAAKERQEAEQAISDLINPLSDAIKKYAYHTKNEKLAKYAENPIDALTHDYSFSIIKHVPGIKEAIQQDKPERQPKAQETIQKITKENLGKLIHRYANSKKRESDIHNEIALKPIMKEYEQYAQDLKQLNEKITQLEKAIQNIKIPSDYNEREQIKTALEKHNIKLL